MTLPLVWSRVARQDLREIADYIAERNPPAAKRMRDLIRRTAEQLPAHPYMYRPGRVPGTREAVAHPNYILIYEVTDRIRIIAVQHARRQYP